VGTRHGPYTVLSKLGEGAFGVTLLVRRSRSKSMASGFEKLVALKVIREQYVDDPEFGLRALDEATLQALLRHDELVDVYDLRRMGPDLVIEMEYVDGVTLEAFAHGVELVSMAPETAVYIAACLLRGAAFVHDARDPQGTSLGLVHRDLKPSNVLISRSGSVKIADFGCVSSRGRHYDSDDKAPRLLGTPRYIAPEQCLGEPVTGKADVYAVGVMLYELLSRGKHPTLTRDYDNDYDMILAKLRCEPAPLYSVAGGLPRELADVVDSMIERDPALRPDAEDALERLMNVVRFDGMGAQRALSTKVQRYLARMAHESVTAADSPTEWIMANTELSPPSAPTVPSLPFVRMAPMAKSSMVARLSRRPTELRWRTLRRFLRDAWSQLWRR
jgi:serine/threonine-protein kinase